MKAIVPCAILLSLEFPIIKARWWERVKVLLDNYSIGVTLTQILSRWTRLVSRVLILKEQGTIDIQSVDNTELGYIRKENFKEKAMYTVSLKYGTG